MQKGMSENDIEKSYQSHFNLQWAWADSIATEVKQTFSQLKTAKINNIARIKEQLSKKTKKAHKTLVALAKVKVPTEKQKNQAKGLKSKIVKIQALKRQLKQLESTERLHICFAGRKLFNAQFHLEENGYKNHQEWLKDWQAKRSGRFYCIGKSQVGGGTMIKIYHVAGDNFKATITLPRFMQNEYGKIIDIPFQVTECRRRRKTALLYALEQQKPITVQVFRRENKKNQWYIHLTTYVPEIPTTTSLDNGCLGVDFNRNSVEWAYVSKDGNIKEKGKILFPWKGFSSGQRQAMMRNLVAQLTKLAFEKQCPIAIESLDFTKRKAAMSENSKLYNQMLSNLSTSLFRDSLISRCQRYGIELQKVNPAFTSIIGMIKFMPQYGLNSGTAAAMVIARRAMNYSERAPKCLVRPEDRARHSWTTWNRIARFLKNNKVRRSELFDWMKTLEEMLISSDIDEMVSYPSPVSSLSDNQQGKSPSPDPKYEQLCLGF
jgi:IS605 OrfB family transposase